MRKSYLVAAAAAALTTLAGCTADSPKATGLPGPSAVSSVPGAPEATVDPGATPTLPPPATPGAVQPTAPVNQPAGDPTVAPSRPAGLPSFSTTIRSNWVIATVTKGGAGPCFTLTSSDGVAFAAYSTVGVRLDTGAQVRARLIPGKTPVSCGSGRPVTLDHVQLAG